MLFIISIHSVARPRLFPWSSCCGLYVFQSTRSQDRDEAEAGVCGQPLYFNPLGRKTETRRNNGLYVANSFQSTRSQDRDIGCIQGGCELFISIHSVARPRHGFIKFLKLTINFNPLGRKTETAKLNNY